MLFFNMFDEQSIKLEPGQQVHKHSKYLPLHKILVGLRIMGPSVDTTLKCLEHADSLSNVPVQETAPIANAEKLVYPAHRFADANAMHVRMYCNSFRY